MSRDGGCTGGDWNSLPADVTQVIFNALNLSLEEKKVILPLLQDNRGVTIEVMLDYISDRFKTYEMIAAALGPGTKSKYPPAPPRFKSTLDIVAGAALVEGEQQQQPRGRRRGRGGRSRGQGRVGEQQDPPHPGAGGGKETVLRKPLICEYCAAKKKAPADHHMSMCQWISAATQSDLVQTLPKICTGCLQKR